LEREVRLPVETGDCVNVLLVHGLGRTPGSMFPLAAALRKGRHRVHYFGYSTTLETWDRIVGRLVAKLRTLALPVGLVGHSLGGLLLRAAIAKLPELKVHHFVMLGTPNRSPRLASYFWKWVPFRMFTQTSGRMLAHPVEYDSLPIPDCPTTIFAGTAGPRGRLSPFGNEPNDGLVAVSETVLEGHPPPIELPVLHTWMMNDRRIHAAIVDRMSA
jgi:pimeloyl-ACP methyl ester carboxylesterase